MRRAVLCAAALTAAMPAAQAAGHAVVRPSAARPADPQVYRVTIPNELGSATVDVRMRVPAGIDFLLLETPPPGWTGRIVRRGDTIREVRWSGGRIPAEQFAEFRFLARNPVEEGEITWPIVQRYADGQVQRWIGPAGSDEPAARTRISESAAPEDVVSVNGERVAAADAPAARAPAPVEDAGRDGVTLGLAVGGLACGLLALGTSLTNRRRT